MKKYSATIFMASLALICLVIHFVFGWNAYVSEAQSHQETAQMSAYLIEWGRDVFENLQSEFIQLAFQMALLAGLFGFFHVKSYEEDNEQMKRDIEELKNR